MRSPAKSFKIFAFVILFTSAIIFLLIIKSSSSSGIFSGYPYVFSESGTDDEADSIFLPETDSKILNDSSFVLQKNDMANLLAKNSRKLQCFLNKKYIVYSLCSYPGELHLKDLMSYGWNTDIVERIVGLLKSMPNAAFIDVGTNIGGVSLPIMKKFAKRRPVLMVEPNPENLASLLTGISENKLENHTWKIIQRAIWNTTDQVANILEWAGLKSSNGHLDLMGNMSGTHLHLHPDHLKGNRPLPVKTATFDSHILPVAQAMGVKVAVMKIDIEGSECVAFTKAQKFLSGINIPYIFMEYWPALKLQDDWPCIGRMIQTLDSLGYIPFRPFNWFWPFTSGQLDISAYKEWKDYDILWKKIP